MPPQHGEQPLARLAGVDRGESPAAADRHGEGVATRDQQHQRHQPEDAGRGGDAGAVEPGEVAVEQREGVDRLQHVERGERDRDDPRPAPTAVERPADDRDQPDVDRDVPPRRVAGHGRPERARGRHGRRDQLHGADRGDRAEADHAPLVDGCALRPAEAEEQHQAGADRVLDVGEGALQEQQHEQDAAHDEPAAEAPRRAHRRDAERRDDEQAAGRPDVERLAELHRPAPAGQPQHVDERRGGDHPDELSDPEADDRQAPAAPVLEPAHRGDGEQADQGVVPRHLGEEAAGDRRPPAPRLEGGDAVGDPLVPGLVAQRPPQRRGGDAGGEVDGDERGRRRMARHQAQHRGGAPRPPRRDVPRHRSRPAARVTGPRAPAAVRARPAPRPAGRAGSARPRCRSRPRR